MTDPIFNNLVRPIEPLVRLSGEPARVLLVKPSALGDVVHSLPVLNLIRRRFPQACISWLVSPAFAPLVENHPAGCEAISFDRRRLNPVGRGSSAWAEVAALAGGLAERRFDLVLDLQGLLRSGLLTLATLAPVRVGFANAREGASLAYTHRVASRGTERHAIERYLDIAEAIGCGRGPVEYRFGVDDADRRAVGTLLGDDRPFVVLLPGTNWETKKWPIAHYARLAAMLESETGLRPVIAGGADVIGLASRVPSALNLANRTTLPQLVALLDRAALVIANDSGPMHIASALGRPLVTIFGPTNPTRTGPHERPDTVIRLEIACSPCYARRCSHTSCMNWLTPEHVLAQATRTLRDARELMPAGPGVR